MPHPAETIDMAEPWYQDGLRFECTRCGDCCTGAPGFVWVTEAEIEAIAGRLGEPADEVRGLYTREVHGGRRSLRERANGDCVFYDRRDGCTVYEDRPGQCRTWPFWRSNVKSRKDWAWACSVCPGSGKGELIAAEEITRRVRAVNV